MPVEENKELRDLVTETLQAKGVLGKVQAEIRASVFLALEEQDVFKDRSPFLNKQLKDFLQTNNGLVIISLVREFLEFFNLEFTSMVFDPETHAGVDYAYPGREKLSKDLMLNENQENLPLLGLLIDSLKTNGHKINVSNDNDKVDLLNFDTSNGVNGEGDIKEEKRIQEDTRPKETSLTSLSNLPPLKTSNRNVENLKAILDLGISTNEDEEFVTHVNEEHRNGIESEESEIEEEISQNSNHSGDDNTADLTVSKASGHGDYLENGGKPVLMKKEVSRDGDGDKKSDSMSKKNVDIIKSTKLDFSPMTTNMIPPKESERCLSPSTSSERVDLDHSKCDTISEVDEIEEEFSTNPTVSETPEKLGEEKSSNKMDEIFGNVKTLQTIDNAVTQLVHKKIPQLANLPLTLKSSDEIVIMNRVEDSKEGIQKKKGNELPSPNDNVASVITQNDITIKIDESPKNKDVGERVTIGGQQLDKEEYKSIFQELEKGLGAKIESIYIPEEPKIQVTLTPKLVSQESVKGREKVTNRLKDKMNSEESLRHEIRKSTRSASKSPDKIHQSRHRSSDSAKRFYREKNEKADKKDNSETSSYNKSGKIDLPNTASNESNCSVRSRNSLGEKLKQVDTSNLESVFKFGVDTSYEEFCKFKNELLKLKGYHANKDDSSCSLTSVSSCSKGKCSEKILNNKEENTSTEGKSSNSPLPKVLPPLKINRNPRHKTKTEESASSIDSKKSPENQTSKKNETEEMTQDISVSSISIVGDYMEPVSFSAPPPKF